MSNEQQLRWCENCGEGITNFCRGDGNTRCPSGFDKFSRTAQPMPEAAAQGLNAAEVLAALDALKDDAAAHIFPSDLDKCSRSECEVEVYSVRAGNPAERTVPLFSREQVAAALSTPSAAPQAKEMTAQRDSLSEFMRWRCEQATSDWYGRTLEEMVAAYRAEFSASPAAPEVAKPEAVNRYLNVTLTKDEAEYISAFIADENESDDDVVQLVVGSGHSGFGLYGWHPEYQEEGSVLIKSLPKPEPLKAADEFELRRLLMEERETVRQLNRALREATEAPTFMGEPVAAQPPHHQPQAQGETTCGDSCRTEAVELQENGIVRSADGKIIGRLVEDLDALCEAKRKEGIAIGENRAREAIAKRDAALVACVEALGLIVQWDENDLALLDHHIAGAKAAITQANEVLGRKGGE